MAEKEATERRVYVLPVELVERVRQYQKDNMIASEVEAVRRLLDTALYLRDNVHSILSKLRERYRVEKDFRVLSRDILSMHPLVEGIKITSTSLDFDLKDGGRGSIASSGKTFYDVGDDNWREDLDDEIPF